MASAVMTPSSVSTPVTVDLPTPREAGDPPVAQLGAALLRGAHHGGGELARVDDRGRVGRADPLGDDDAVGEPVEVGRRATARLALGDDEPA